MTRTVLLAVALFVAAIEVSALIQVGKGNAPIHDPGWPPGALEVANLKSRVGWIEGPPFGGGQYTFFFRGDTAACQATLDQFAAIQAESLELVLRAGAGTSGFLNDHGRSKEDGSFDWSFHVWVPANWNRLYNATNSYFASDQPNFRQPVAAPRFEIWIGDGSVDWDRIRLPSRVRVLDQRSSAHGYAPGEGSVIRVAATDYRGEPISGACVTVAPTEPDADAGPLTATGDSQGLAVLTGIPAGTYALTVAAPGFAPRALEYERYGPNDYREFKTRLAPLASLTGRTLDGAGLPLEGVKVRARTLLGPDETGYRLAEPAEVVSDADGRFKLTGLPEGKLQLSARHAGYHHQWEPTRLVQTGTDPVTLQLIGTGNLRVSVVDEQGEVAPTDGQREIHVHIQEAGRTGVGSWGGSARLGADGSFTFRNVPPGAYRVSLQPFIDDQKPSGNDEVIAEVDKGRTTEVQLVRPTRTAR